MSYFVKRLLLMIPTLWLILLINFLLVQLAPGGPVEQQLAKMQSEQQAMATQGFGMAQQVLYQGSQGLSESMLAELNTRFGFDLPIWERFWLMTTQYLRFDLGDSFFQGQSVWSLILQKLPISILLGGLSLFVIYGVGVVLGVYQSQRHGTLMDRLLMLVLAVLHALPVFMLAVLLLMLFAGVAFWQIFPIQGIHSPQFEQMTWWQKTLDLLWHLALPVLASSLGSIASIAYLTKFGMLAEGRSPYVLAAKTKGFLYQKIIYKQMLKNAFLPIAAQFPLAITGILFSGNFLIEIIFGIDGLGRLGYDAVVQRDYPVMFGILYLLTLIGMLVQLACDLWYQKLDPRIDYGA